MFHLRWSRGEGGAGRNFSSSWADCCESLITHVCDRSDSSPRGRDASLFPAGHSSPHLQGDLNLCRLSCPVCVTLATRSGPRDKNMTMITGKRAGLCISSVWQLDCRKNSQKLVISEVPLQSTLFIIHVLEIYPSHTPFCVCLCSLFCNPSN